MSKRKITENERRDRDPPQGESGRGNADQGIVRDERGQEQPADKDRAQQTSKTQ